ncbi:hypothetical protein [Photobacterium phosphoreum]|uniref:hypothetical protein n=1 Tax=Photobacterium phosphoreum TaxID=659 RepID=UPI0015E65FDD|nr:hypothetical protein [Photobacterium phosphoreum]
MENLIREWMRLIYLIILYRGEIGEYKPINLKEVIKIGRYLHKAEMIENNIIKRTGKKIEWNKDYLDDNVIKDIIKNLKSNTL